MGLFNLLFAPRLRPGEEFYTTAAGHPDIRPIDPSRPATPKPPTYEYKSESITTFGAMGQGLLTNQLLNKMAKQGWEMTGQSSVKYGSTIRLTFTFRRVKR